MRYILLLPAIVVLGCAPAANLDTASVSQSETRCASMAASYQAAKDRKAKIETAETARVNIDEAVFSWPTMLAKRIGNFSDANAAAKKMRELKKAMRKQKCAGVDELD